MKPLANISKSTLAASLLVLMLAAYAGARILNLSQAVQKVKTTADTPSYVRISKEPILTSEFLAGARPFVFPLLLKLFGSNEEAAAWVQGIFSILSWSLLAVAVAGALRTSWLRLAAFGLILIFSLDRYILGWDSALLTESVSLSLMALFLAGWFWLVRGWHWGKAAVVLLVGLLWTFTRDTNAWVVLMAALWLLLLAALRLVERKYLVLSGAFLVMFFLSNLSADRGDRWVFPFQNILGQRILSNARALDFFTRCGMPVSPALLQLTGEYANSAERAFYEDPALTEYRQWLHQDGKRCYMQWLLSDPLRSIRAPLLEFNALISLQDLQPFLFSKRFSPLLPGWLESVLFPRRGLLIALLLVWLSALSAVLTRAWLHNKTWWVVIGMNVLLLPHYLITWHGDVMGIYRHVLSASLQFYLGLWLLVLLVLDGVFSLKAVRQGFLKSFSLRNTEQQRNIG